MPKTIQTMAWAYQQICEGEDPWTALGNFKNAWYDYAKDIRAALVSEPLGKPEPATEHTRHWGAFCAASVEFLCDRYEVPCPEWVYEPCYTLSSAPQRNEQSSRNLALCPAERNGSSWSMTCLATPLCFRGNRIFVFTTTATFSFVLALPFPFSSLTYG